MVALLPFGPVQRLRRSGGADFWRNRTEDRAGGAGIGEGVDVLTRSGVAISSRQRLKKPETNAGHYLPRSVDEVPAWVWAVPARSWTA